MKLSIPPRTSLLVLALLLALVGVAGCSPSDPHGDDEGHTHGEAGHTHEDEAAEEGHSHREDGESWALTAWGEHFEIFPEIDPLVAGKTAFSHTHVTHLNDFSPMTEGTVMAVLTAADGTETVFRANSPVRPGIYNLEIRPASPGRFELAFRIFGTRPEKPQSEEIPAGRVRVGTEDDPGGLVEPPPGPAAGLGSAEPVAFLKEEQWQTPFATAWTERGAIRASVRGPGRIRPAAGGEIVLTAPVSGVVAAPQGAGWPYRGASIRRGGAVLQVTPRSGDDASLARREAEVHEVEAELEVARRRLIRLRELLEVEAVARREVEETEARVAALEARADAARRDLASTRAVRQTEERGERDDGRTVWVPAESVEVRAPWPGRVAEVRVTPGEAVAAGAGLARLVRTRPLWLEVALSPVEAAQIAGDPAGLLLTLQGAEDALAVDGVRRIAESPEVDPVTGTVAVLLEIGEPGEALTIGAAVDAEILLPEPREGLVIPASALVDDGGTAVVFVQLDGESFVRREITVTARQGDRLLVTGLAPGERLVTLGGAAIRRSTLVTSGGEHGHIH